ncbi:hypothetical protein D3C79_907810 [compost metagenome]
MDVVQRFGLKRLGMLVTRVGVVPEATARLLIARLKSQLGLFMISTPGFERDGVLIIQI